MAEWRFSRVPHHPTIRNQLPLALDNRSGPEPDPAVVRGGIRDYTQRHPGAPDTVLVVEVAETSLQLDRGDKLRVYASAGIPEYWIVNLVDGVIERHRSPASERYEDVQTLHRDNAIAPLGRESPAANVADLLP